MHQQQEKQIWLKLEFMECQVLNILASPELWPL